MHHILFLVIVTYCCGIAHAAPPCLSKNIRYLFFRQTGRCEDVNGRPGLNQLPRSLNDKVSAAQFLKDQSKCLNGNTETSTGLCMNLNGLDFSGQSLAGTDLTGSSMVGTNFTRADLRHAQLYVVDASQSVFVRADLSSARLAGARFSGSNLQDSTITWAHITETDFRGANLSGATFRYSSLARSVFNSRTILPEEWGATPEERMRHAVEVQQMRNISN